jgi:glycerol-3-phosphate dehydrogenase
MNRNIQNLQNKYFDLIVIGGGISGACLAWDAVSRGLSVALVEKGDFGAATSSASSKILHGGIRYLQHANFLKVRESAMERCYFQILAPHLTYYVPFIIPSAKSLLRGKTALRMAMLMYDLLSLGGNGKIKDPLKKVPISSLLNKSEVLRRVPGLNAADHEVTGGILLYESHMFNSERMTLAFLRSADRKGADIANYVKVESFIEGGNKIEGLMIRDLQSNGTFAVRGSIVANATGPWITEVNNLVRQKKLKNVISDLSKGIHIVTRQLFENYALGVITTKRNQALLTRGGRHIFVIPWRSHSLIGTSYSAFKTNPDDLSITEEEIQEFIHDINNAIPGIKLGKEDIMYAFGGLYPLTDNQMEDNVYQGISNYQIIDHKRRDDIEGLVSVLCAKYTTARKLAEKSIDLICKKLGGNFAACTTFSTPLFGGDIKDTKEYVTSKKKEYACFLSEDTIEHLIRNYGTGIDEIVSLFKEKPEYFSMISDGQEVIKAEIAYAVSEEMALHLGDVIFRRTGLGTLGHPGNECIMKCAEIMGRIHKWDKQTMANEIDKTNAIFKNMCIKGQAFMYQ